MEQEAVKLAVSQGIWAVLFLILLFYVLRTNEKRENKLTDILKQVTDQLASDIRTVKQDVDELKDIISSAVRR